VEADVDGFSHVRDDGKTSTRSNGHDKVHKDKKVIRSRTPFGREGCKGRKLSARGMC
jgi:hypothetical protein